VLQDDQQFMWVAGLPDNSRLIVQGQDFVRDAQVVETVKASNIEASAQ
jgi:multidrug efflux system membrane fusion protein